jgi:hypothetical protein
MVRRDIQQALVGLQRKGKRFLDELGILVGRPYPAAAADGIAGVVDDRLLDRASAQDRRRHGKDKQ